MPSLPPPTITRDPQRIALWKRGLRERVVRHCGAPVSACCFRVTPGLLGREETLWSQPHYRAPPHNNNDNNNYATEQPQDKLKTALMIEPHLPHPAPVLVTSIYTPCSLI